MGSADLAGPRKLDSSQKSATPLLRNDDKTYDEIMAFKSFKDDRSQGNYRKSTPEYIEELLSVIEQEPKVFGYEFGRWTTSRLATHLGKTTGIEMSRVQVRRILKQKKYGYLWAKYRLEDQQDAEKRASFKVKLEEELARSEAVPEQLKIWFWDESRFSLRVIRRQQWGKRGKRKKFSGKRRRGRVNLMGDLRYNDRKQKCYFIGQGNSDSFYANLVKLNEYYD